MTKWFGYIDPPFIISRTGNIIFFNISLAGRTSHPRFHKIYWRREEWRYGMRKRRNEGKKKGRKKEEI